MFVFSELIYDQLKAMTVENKLLGQQSGT